MTRVHFVKKARKDYPQYGIQKGESYYWWKFRYGPKSMSKTPPRQSELTQSDFLSRVYGVQEDLEDLSASDFDQDIEEERDNVVSELEELRDETQEKHDNMPDQLQESETGQLLQERVDSLDSMISDLQSVDCEIDEESIRQEIISEYAKPEELTEEQKEEIEEKVREAIEKKRQEIIDELIEIQYEGE
jgi:hypothetical protein